MLKVEKPRSGVGDYVENARLVDYFAVVVLDAQPPPLDHHVRRCLAVGHRLVIDDESEFMKTHEVVKLKVSHVHSIHFFL